MTNSESQISEKLEDYTQSRIFEDHIYSLMSKAYADIKDRNVHIEWGRTGANAVLVASQNKSDKIRCNRVVRDWPESALFGLLSHELSHIALGVSFHSELQADEDVIARGLGPYLAIERVFTNKYSDYIMRNGEDKYLGYESIKKLLKTYEVHHLDILMSDLAILEEFTED